MLGFLRGAREAPRIERVRGTERAQALSQLHATAFAHPWDATEFERMLVAQDITAHALLQGRSGEAVGLALSRRVLDEAEILTVVVARNARGAGHAGRLLATHLAALAGHGVHIVHLEVEDGNAPALALYRRLGFRGVGRREGYYHRPDGTRAAAITMSRSLE